MVDKVISPECRVAFANGLFTPRPRAEGKEPEYTCVLLFDLDTDISKMKKAAIGAALERFGDTDKTRQLIKSGEIKMPFRDRSAKDWAGGEGTFLAVSSGKTQPGMVIGPRKEDVLDPSDVWSGWYAMASLRPYAWDHPTGGKGVSFGLMNVWFRKPGERMDGRTSPDQDFGDMDASDIDDGDVDDVDDIL